MAGRAGRSGKPAAEHAGSKDLAKPTRWSELSHDVRKAITGHFQDDAVQATVMLRDRLLGLGEYDGSDDAGRALFSAKPLTWLKLYTEFQDRVVGRPANMIEGSSSDQRTQGSGKILDFLTEASKEGVLRIAAEFCTPGAGDASRVDRPDHGNHDSQGVQPPLSLPPEAANGSGSEPGDAGDAAEDVSG